MDIKPMDTNKVSSPEPLPPVSVSVIASDKMPLQTGTEATTPGSHVPNIVVNVVSPFVAIAVRFGHLYLTILVSLVAAGRTTDIIPAEDFAALVVACAKLSLSGACLGALKDAVGIFARLEQKFPLSSGGV